MTDIKRPSMKSAILAKCHDCMGHYADGGTRDCRNAKCSLYFWMPYATLPEDREWELYSPKKAGLILKADAARKMTPEQRQACAERLAKARASHKLLAEDSNPTEESDDSEDMDEDDE